LKAADPLRAYGAVIGKALKPFALGRGLRRFSSRCNEFAAGQCGNIAAVSARRL
jgi:hypothetical protein